MKIIIIILLSITPVYCLEASCFISENDISILSKKNRNIFAFNIEKLQSDKVTIEMVLPKMVNGQPFKSLYLVGKLPASRNFEWGVPIAVLPILTNESLVGTELLLPENMLKNSWISVSYGKGECLPYMQYEINQLMMEAQDEK